MSDEELRDRFAAAALQAALTNSQSVFMTERDNRKSICRLCYAWADSMMKEREQQ